MKNDYSLNIDAVEAHILREILDREIGNLCTLPLYVDASQYTALVIGIRKKLDYILLDIKRSKLPESDDDDYDDLMTTKMLSEC